MADDPKRYDLGGHDLFWHIDQGLLDNLPSPIEVTLVFNAIKYSVRYPYKNGAEDVGKAIDCLTKLKERLEKNDTRTHHSESD